MNIAVISDVNNIYIGSIIMHNVSTSEKTDNTWTKTNEINLPGFGILHGYDISADYRYVYFSSRNTDPSFKLHFEVENESSPEAIEIIDTYADEVIKLIEKFDVGLVVEK
jgi:hypothetical protein